MCVCTQRRTRAGTKQTAKRPIIDGPTYQTLRPDGCNWWLEGDKLHLELEKAIDGIDWPEVIEKPGVRSNRIDREEEARKKRQAEVEVRMCTILVWLSGMDACAIGVSCVVYRIIILMCGFC